MKEKELFKKLMQLIEDNIVFTDNENHDKRVETLKFAFRDVGLKCFIHLRDCTNSLVNRFPLKSDIDENLICCSLPDESFESYNENEELTLKALKVTYNFFIFEALFDFFPSQVVEAIDSSSDFRIIETIFIFIYSELFCKCNRL